jgi:hypothetical protein
VAAVDAVKVATLPAGISKLKRAMLIPKKEAGAVSRPAVAVACAVPD